MTAKTMPGHPTLDFRTQRFLPTLRIRMPHIGMALLYLALDPFPGASITPTVPCRQRRKIGLESGHQSSARGYNRHFRQILSPAAPLDAPRNSPNSARAPDCRPGLLIGLLEHLDPCGPLDLLANTETANLTPHFMKAYIKGLLPCIV
jgi:hypothetical protein